MWLVVREWFGVSLFFHFTSSTKCSALQVAFLDTESLLAIRTMKLSLPKWILCVGIWKRPGWNPSLIMVLTIGLGFEISCSFMEENSPLSKNCLTRVTEYRHILVLHCKYPYYKCHKYINSWYSVPYSTDIHSMFRRDVFGKRMTRRSLWIDLTME